ncbi:MAG: hypothetical protein P4M11_03025 [Candidatus Pacebacteria bacterium]|nr:hypothetical protein [Candidatus Paceibacterota bacterium]
MADYRKEIELSRKTKLFYVDFTPLIAHAHGNLISILNGKQLQVIEVLCISPPIDDQYTPVVCPLH